MSCVKLFTIALPMKRLFLILALASLAAPAALARVRVVRHPAEPCSFSLVPAWGAAAVPAAGQTRGIVFVYGQTASCAQWNGYSSVDWVTVEAAPMDAQPAAYVTVSPNDSPQARTASLIIAGVRLDVTQEGAPAIANPNLVTNGTFNTNIDGWIWYSPRFPNGIGTASWSPLDANGSPASGSISLRDTGSDKALQRLQCLPVNKSTDYRFGTKVRTLAPKERGDGTIALLTYKTPDCTGEYIDYEARLLSPVEPNVWQEYSFTMRTGSRTQSVILVIASGAVQGSFETLFDDVFVMPAE
jgi:hypothetical protein